MNTKKRHLKQQDGARPTNHFVSNKIANRLENLGYKPFRSEAERYLVTKPTDGAPSELIEIGRAWKGGRFFRNNIVGRDAKLVKEFGEFASADKLKDCYFWNVSLTGCKANISSLIGDVERFNSDINQHLTELRKKHHFELLVLALHFRYDENHDAIDLHAHIVCRVPPKELEATQLYLSKKFSLAYVEAEPIENPEAVVNYMFFGVFDNFEMVDWPDDALGACWEMTQAKRYRYVRTAGSFARWRKQNRTANDNVPGTGKRGKSAFVPAPGQSRFLAKVMAKIRGKRVAALLFERHVDTRCDPASVMEYSTASCSATQDSENENTKVTSNDQFGQQTIATKPLRVAKKLLRRLSNKIISEMGRFKRAILGRLRV